MENRTIDSYEELSKCSYKVQLLKKALESESVHSLTQAEKENFLEILNEHGLKLFCNGIYVGLEVRMTTLASNLRNKQD